VSASIRVGVGGWTYEPWRGGNFFPKGLPAARELEYASRKLTTIEVNGTYYSLQKPSTFARWRDETPDDFVFTVKAHRLTTQRRVLAEGADSVQRFLASGVTALGAKLGPIVWQLPPTQRFEAQDLEAFLCLLPLEADGIALRHALEVRHESFKCEAYLDLARRHGVTTVFTDSPDYASFADLTGPFVYVRTMRTQPGLPRGCSEQALDQIAASLRAWRDGDEPLGLARVSPAPASSGGARDVFLFFISGAKEKAPAAAMAVLERLSG
jgi:uncharacterized protein YecE (DUF72 family)